MKMTERVMWKNYFLGQKYKMIAELGYTRNEIIQTYERNYAEHEASLSTWIGTIQEEKKRDLMFGLLKAIEKLKEESLEEQLTFL